MALSATHKDTEFSVGDTVKVSQKIEEADKTRDQIFEGMVIGIKGRNENRSFIVRKVGVQNIGIERIFPLNSPAINSIEVVRHGKRGVKRAKLYYTRDKKSKKAEEEIYSRAKRRNNKD